MGGGAVSLGFEDRARRVAGMPDAIRKRTTVIVAADLQEDLRETYVIEAVAVESGVYTFLEVIDKEGQAHRLALPPKVTAAILRMREAITAAKRKRGGRIAAAKAREAGIVPFQKKAL